MMIHEHPADERAWTLPASERLVVVARRVWPSLAIGLVVWLGWLAVRRRRRRAP
jgi:hypothetical protein